LKTPLRFFYYLLLYLNLPKYIQSGPKPGLNRNDVYKLKFSACPPKIQKVVVKVLDKKFQEWGKYRQKIENIEKQYQHTKNLIENISNSILNSAVSGKLVD